MTTINTTNYIAANAGSMILGPFIQSFSELSLAIYLFATTLFELIRNLGEVGVDREKLKVKTGLNLEEIDSVITIAKKSFQNAEFSTFSYHGRIVACKKGKGIFISNALVGEGSYKKVYSGVIFDFNGSIKEKALIVTKDKEIVNEKRIVKEIHSKDVAKLGKLMGKVDDVWYYLGPLWGSDATKVVGDKNKIRALLGAARSLASMHEKGFIHGDVKPENILVKYAKNKFTVLQAALGDLGLTKRQAEIEALDGGTAIYSPPECFKVDNEGDYTKADMWSFGVTLYELMCSNRPLFIEEKWPTDEIPLKAERFLARLSRLQQQDVDKCFRLFPAMDLSPKAHNQLKELIVNLLQIDPSKRMSAKEAVDCLTSILNS